MPLHRLLLTSVLLCLGSIFNLISAQVVVVDSLGSSTFTYSEGDTTYLMKQYFMVFLEEGDHRDQADSLVNVIQAQHLKYLDSLATEGIIQLSGPFGDDGEVRGISIYRVPDIVTAESLANSDPAVKVGRLKVRVRPWWGAVGTELR